MITELILVFLISVAVSVPLCALLWPYHRARMKELEFQARFLAEWRRDYLMPGKEIHMDPRRIGG